MKPLIVHQFFKANCGDTYCIHAAFDLPTIIEAGYAPDDVIDYVIDQCIELHKTKEWLMDLLDIDGADGADRRRY